MTYIAISVPVIESERGWGAKIDDYMVCLSNKDASEFISEFNSENKDDAVPDWYMYASSETKAIDITQTQMEFLQREKNVWLKELQTK